MLREVGGSRAISRKSGQLESFFGEETVRSRFVYLMLGVCTVLSSSVPVLAHHGAADYDTTQTTIVKGGTVTRFDFVNPHIEIYWDAKNSEGAVEHWHAEGTTPNILFRNGWTKESLKPGMELESVEGNRCKSGGTCMRLKKITLANGTDLPVPQ